jgi:glutaminyl-tRNA synthetase
VVEKSAAMLPARPRQIEFSRLNMTRTVMSKRYLRQLVEGGYVSGWDDPRMPTLSAMRRRGYTPRSIRNFVSLIGMSKADSTVDFAVLEHCVRDDLGDQAPRAMAVLDPLKVVLTNWPEDETKDVVLENHPDHPEMGSRTLAFGRELYIEREDFMEVPVKKYQRMFPGNEVRLKGAYIVRCDSCVKDENGKSEIRDVELDAVAESLDHKTILIGECKWTTGENGRLLTKSIRNIVPYLPFTNGKNVVIKLFTKVCPEEDQGNALLPADVLRML